MTRDKMLVSLDFKGLIVAKKSHNYFAKSI